MWQEEHLKSQGWELGEEGTGLKEVSAIKENVCGPWSEGQAVCSEGEKPGADGHIVQSGAPVICDLCVFSDPLFLRSGWTRRATEFPQPKNE